MAECLLVKHSCAGSTPACRGPPPLEEPEEGSLLSGGDIEEGGILLREGGRAGFFLARARSTVLSPCLSRERELVLCLFLP